MAVPNIVPNADFTIYRALVVSNNDEKNLGRVKIRIEALHGLDKDIPAENLPWASVCQTGASAGSGGFIVPEVGSTVIVAFEGGNRDNPVVLGGIYTRNKEKDVRVSTSNISHSGRGRIVKAKSNDVPQTGQEDISSRVLYQSPKGSAITFFDTDDSEQIELKDANGNYISLSSPMSEKAVTENSHQDRSAKSNLMSVSQIIMANPFGQMVKIMSNGNQGIINVVDQVKNQGVEINASGYTRLFNQSGLGVEVYLDETSVSLRTSLAEISLSNGEINIKGKKITLNGTDITVNAGTMKLGASTMNIGAPSINMDGNIKAGVLHYHGHAQNVNITGGASAPSVDLAVPVQQPWVDPSETLTVMTSEAAQKTQKALSDTRRSLDNAISKLQQFKVIVDQSSSVSANLDDMVNYAIASTVSTDSRSQELTQNSLGQDVLKDIPGYNGPDYNKISENDTVSVIKAKRLAQENFMANNNKEKKVGTQNTVEEAFNNITLDKAPDSASVSVTSFLAQPQAYAYVSKYLNSLGIASTDISSIMSLKREMADLDLGSLSGQISTLIASMETNRDKVFVMETSVTNVISATDTTSASAGKGAQRNHFNRILTWTNNSIILIHKTMLLYVTAVQKIMSVINGVGSFVRLVTSILTDINSAISFASSVNINISSITSSLLGDITILTNPANGIVKRLVSVNNIARLLGVKGTENLQQVLDLVGVVVTEVNNPLYSINPLDDFNVMKSKLMYSLKI